MQLIYILQAYICIFSFTTLAVYSPLKFISISSMYSDDTSDRQYMRRAVHLASLALGKTRPNPCVGCVIVDVNGTIVGEGWHQKAGEAHAEVYALQSAGERARGGTAYVSLEPCNHFGRTPPCTHALLR